MNDQHIPDWAWAQALRGWMPQAGSGYAADFVRRVTDRARELSAQQPEAARGECICDDAIRFDCPVCVEDPDPQPAQPANGEAVAPWRYSIQHGPEGEQNYAFVYDGRGQFVGNLRTHHAVSIVEAFNGATDNVS